MCIRAFTLTLAFFLSTIASAGTDRLSCDASPNYPKWSFGQGLTGASQIQAPISGGFVGTDLTLKRGSISNAGRGNALLERLSSKCMLNGTYLKLEPSIGNAPYISDTIFDGGDSRSGSPLSVRVIISSTDGQAIRGPIFKDSEITRAWISLTSPVINFAAGLKVEEVSYELETKSLSTSWKELFSGTTITRTLSIKGPNRWTQIDFGALETAIDLNARSLDISVTDCLESTNGDGTCYPQNAPTAELRKLVQTQNLNSLRLKVASSSYYHANPCVISNIKELCSDPLIAQKLTIYQVDEYGFSHDANCGQAPISCEIH